MQKLTLALSLAAALIACAQDRSPEEVVAVAAASNLGAPLRELSAAFEKDHPGIVVETSFGASGALTTQIRQGAPFAIFLSADTALPEKLHAEGLAVAAPKVYARGRLVLFSAAPRDFSGGISLLTAPAVRIVAIANPETAPYGTAAREVLVQAGLLDIITPKLARAQTVAQVVQMVMSAADCGFIAGSSLYAPEMAEYNRKGIYWMEIDPSLYTPIDQAVVMLRPGEGNAAANVFYDFLFTPEARIVFTSCGYDAVAYE